MTDAPEDDYKLRRSIVGWCLFLNIILVSLLVAMDAGLILREI